MEHKLTHNNLLFPGFVPHPRRKRLGKQHMASGGNCNGNVTSHGYNMSSDGTCNFNGPGDQRNINPSLGTLGNNGGPTQTMALLPGSPAMNAGNPSGCTDRNGHMLTIDQRGDARPSQAACDMGAYNH